MNEPTPLTRTIEVPAGASPAFVTVTLVFARTATRSGNDAITVHRATAGAPTLPAASVARTASEWSSTPASSTVCGLAQGANGVSSYEHWNETDCSLAVNSNRAVREVELGGGPAVKLTSGASVSGGGGGAVASVGVVGIGVAVTVAAVVAAAGGDVRFGFGFGVAGARGCVVAA